MSRNQLWTSNVCWCKVRVELRDDTGTFIMSAASDDVEDDDDEVDDGNGIINVSTCSPVFRNIYILVLFQFR